jgi:hypothetical protein
LEANPDKIYWERLSKNPCKVAIRILEANPDKIDWSLNYLITQLQSLLKAIIRIK